MKGYFSKLLTEKERANQGPSVKWGRRLKYDPDSDYEDEINRVGMSRHGKQYGWNGKELTDVLNPLYGFLAKSVGRHWDDVYSELCRSLDRRSVSGLHVFSHLWGYVDRETVMCEDGEVRAWGTGGYLTTPDHFYVHPYTGILCESDFRGWTWRARKKRDRDEEDVTSIPISLNSDRLHGESYQRIDGLWYWVEWTTEDKYDGYYEIRLSWGKNPWNTKQEVRVLKKRQLGKKELKHLGLRNTVVNSL